MWLSLSRCVWLESRRYGRKDTYASCVNESLKLLIYRVTLIGYIHSTHVHRKSNRMKGPKILAAKTIILQVPPVLYSGVRKLTLISLFLSMSRKIHAMNIILQFIGYDASHGVILRMTYRSTDILFA